MKKHPYRLFVVLNRCCDGIVMDKFLRFVKIWGIRTVKNVQIKGFYEKKC